MSQLSNHAINLLSASALDEACKVALDSVMQTPDDFHAHYALGLCYRFSNQFENARAALRRAVELDSSHPSVHLALAISLQKLARYDEAIETLRVALRLDQNYVEAYNTLAMTQKLIGEYENASHNYDCGANALARSIVEALVNSPKNPRFPHRDSRRSLWTGYAIFGALSVVSEDETIKSVCWPTSEIAERDAETREFEGWLWEDAFSRDGDKSRCFLPNFFNTFYHQLRANSLYANLMGNRSTVLQLLGKEDASQEHLEEAYDFSS